jgi:threonine dehydratase
MLPTIFDMRQAVSRIAGTALRTPLVRLDAPGAPAEIWLKLENLQPIGSFKIRGAANAIGSLAREQIARGVLTASAGNMAQGVAWCARERGLPCTVIAPDTAPAAKIVAIERLGGRVIRVPFERWWQTFQDRSYPGIDGAFIHAFDDPCVMAGNATIGIEIAEELPDVEAVVIPWGGGGLSCGIGAAMRELAPRCRVLVAEAATATPFAAAFAAGMPQTVDYKASFVDGIGSRSVFPRMLDRALAVVDGALVCTLEEIVSALRVIAERARVIAEGAGACAVAAALSGRAGGGKIACIVSGGNIDAATLVQALRGDVPA